MSKLIYSVNYKSSSIAEKDPIVRRYLE